MKKSKRRIPSIALFALIVPTVLSGCVMPNEMPTEGAEISSSTSLTKEELEAENENLKNENEQLRKRIEEMMNLPEIVVSTVDDRDQVVELQLYTSLEAAEENCSFIYAVKSYSHTLSITMNGSDTWDKINIISSSGHIENVSNNSYSRWKSETLDNVTTVHGDFFEMQTLVITVGETVYYTSMKFTTIT